MGECRFQQFCKKKIEIIDSNENSSGYDIESINPGDTCQILNILNTSQTFNSNMTIVAIDYTPDSAILELETNSDSLGRRTSQIEKKLDNNLLLDVPVSYTS